MTKLNNSPSVLNDIDLEVVTGGSLAMKMEVIEVVNDSYDRTENMKRGLRSDGDLVQSVSDRI